MPDLPTPPRPSPADDPLIAAWLAHLAAHPEATPQHRRFVRLVRAVWKWYAGAGPFWQGVIYLHVRHGEPEAIRAFEERP